MTKAIPALLAAACLLECQPAPTIQLPAPRRSSSTSVEEALLKRRSIRQYKNEPLTLAEISQLLWAAQGTTSDRGLRTAPSAGALYPLEVYAVVGNAKGLEPGVYKYASRPHTLTRVLAGDKRSELAAASLGQSQVQDGAACFVISAVYERTAKRYKDRAVRYAILEAGHAAQNVYLQAAALNLGAVVLGAFSDAKVKSLLNMPEEEIPLYVMPVGKMP